MGTAQIEAVVFDWAGTIIDYGSMAPVDAFVAAFAADGVPITVEEARAPMGTAKRDHTRAILGAPAVLERWRRARGRDPEEGDVERIYRQFVPLLRECLPRRARLVEGVLDVVEVLRARGIAVGTTTGYDAAMAAVCRREAHVQGLEVDVVVSASDVARGRPAPDMCHLCLERLGGVSPRRAVVIDDTVAGVEAGRAAGAWTIGVALSGNEVGMPFARWRELSVPEQARLRARAHRRLAAAHFVVDDVRDVPACIEVIERRLDTVNPAA